MNGFFNNVTLILFVLFLAFIALFEWVLKPNLPFNWAIAILITLIIGLFISYFGLRNNKKGE